MPKFFEYTATGRYYKVYRDGQLVSQHFQEREAIERSNQIKFDFPESEVYYIHEYEVEVGLTDAGLTVQKDYGQQADVAPNITTTPAPIFYQTIADTYNMEQHWFDDGLSTVTSSMSGVLPNGLLYNGNTHSLSYDGVEPATTAQHTLTAQDAAGSDTSSSFDVVIVGTPQITGTPAPSFTEGSSGTYDLSQFVSFGVASQYEPSATYSISGSLGAGLSLDTNTGILSYDGVGAASSNSHTFTVTASTGSAVSDSFSVPVTAVASGDAYLAFSDLISGPDTGLGDGLGSGAIVTIWGFNLGSSQGASTITFTDSTSTERSAAHVYYWKNADGTLPGGPANLYKSHGMQEIAFSVPNSAVGAGTIKVTVGGTDSNTLPFTVRSGNIYHVRSSGSGSGDGSYSDPYATTGEAEGDVSAAGSTIYIHDVNTGGIGTTYGIWAGNTNSSVDSGLTNQFFYVAYPGFKPKITAGVGFSGRSTTGQCVSKMDIYSSSHYVDANGQLDGEIVPSLNQSGCVYGTKDGRIIGNKLQDIAGCTSSEFQGAIKANALGDDQISNLRIFGNELDSYGSEGSSRQHHTMYVSIRDDSGGTYPPYEMGWNYLHDCWAKSGIHYFDEDLTDPRENGDWTGPVHIHDNVVVNQGGSGINIECKDDDQTNDWYVYNNVLINCGLATQWDGLDVDTQVGNQTHSITVRPDHFTGSLYFFHNTVFKWNDDDSTKGGLSAIGMNGQVSGATIQFDNNVFTTDKDKKYEATFSASPAALLDMLSGSNNVWYSSVGSPSYSAPSWDTGAIENDPLVTVTNDVVTLNASSPCIGAGTSPPLTLTRDIYGKIRSGNTIGAVEAD